MSANRSTHRMRRKCLVPNQVLYSPLDSRMLLAGLDVVAGICLPSGLADSLANDAVTTRQMLARAATHSFVKDELVVAIRTSNALTVSGFDRLDWAILTGQSDPTVIQTMLTSVRDNNESVSLVHLRFGPDTDVRDAMRMLDSRPEIMWSAPNFVYVGDARELVPNDPQYGSQYHHPLMKNNLAWDTTLGSPSVVIGITDDGVELAHPDLSANIWINDDVAGDGIDNDLNGYIDDYSGWDFSSNNNNPNPNSSGNSHGTHVSGIAAGRTNNGIGIAGTAGRSTIMPLQFYGVSAWTSTVIFNTFKYAADNGCDIVNTSYNIDGFVGDPTFENAMNYLYDNGVLHFNSAGNNSQLNPPRQAFTQTLLVASTDSTDKKSSFSNYGTGVDVAAPGGSILSTVTGSGYSVFSGTSMAAPNAAGAAALIWSAHPTWTRDQVAAQLLATADNIDGQNPSYVGLLGTGRVNSFLGVTTPSLAAPKVKMIGGLPANAGYVNDLTIDEFTVSFSQIMDATTANNIANFELRSAGPDGDFYNADDILLALDSDQYRIGTNLLHFDILDGPLDYGHYRLTLVSGGLQNPFGSDLDGNGNGVGGDNYLLTFHIAPPSNGSVAFNRASYLVNDLVQINVDDFNAGLPVIVVVTSSAGDSEIVVLNSNGNGNHSGAINTVPATPTQNNGLLEVSLGHVLTVTYHDLDNGSGGSNDVQDTALIANVIQFDSTDTPRTINDSSTVTSTIAVTESGTIADLDVRLDISHTWDADLDVYLIAPNGTRVELFTDVGGSDDNFSMTRLDDEAATSIAVGTAPFAGSYRPEGSLAVLDQDAILGDWTLEITDDASGDAGLLKEWSLLIDLVPSPDTPDIAVVGPGVPVVEGDTGTQTVAFRIELTEPATQVVSVVYATSIEGITNPANPNLDFMTVSGTATFLPGQTTQDIEVIINGEKLIEADELFELVLSNPVNANLATDHATVTIANNDNYIWSKAIDFGNELSPIAYAAAGLSDIQYSLGKGLGWTTSTAGFQFVDRGSGTQTNRDLVLLKNGSFAIDVTMTQLIVRITYGDALLAHDSMRITLEGQVKSPVSTVAGQWITKSYVANVTDGTLNIDFADAGGLDPHVAITGISFARRNPLDTAAPETFNYGRGALSKNELPKLGSVSPNLNQAIATEPIRSNLSAYRPIELERASHEYILWEFEQPGRALVDEIDLINAIVDEFELSFGYGAT